MKGNKLLVHSTFLQFIRFGIVGAICTLLDIGLYALCLFMGVPYLFAGVIGFTVSVIVNYYLSMHYVFESRDDISKQREFIIFIVLSVIGLCLNEVLLYLSIDQLYLKSVKLKDFIGRGSAEMIAKIGATVVVMVFNFVTRKALLEKRYT